MEWLLDPTIWVGLFTLVVLEIVLGIDNLIFIAILADKLPPAQRDRARVIGLSLAANGHLLAGATKRALVKLLGFSILRSRSDFNAGWILFIIQRNPRTARTS